jgi:hypothetical protein
MSGIDDSVPLEHGVSTNIRVIEILKDVADASTGAWPLCKFHTISLDDPPPYIALSYTWASPTDIRSIKIDGKPFEVRETPWSFLELAWQRRTTHFTPDGCKLLFWIDAISIDQTRVKERNHQVGMMADIYSKAEHALVWLRPTAEGDQFCESRSAMRGNGAEAAFWDERVIKLMCTNVYWTRVWILQEYILAPHFKLWYGTLVTISGSVLESVILKGEEKWYLRRARRVVNRRF